MNLFDTAMNKLDMQVNIIHNTCENGTTHWRTTIWGCEKSQYNMTGNVRAAVTWFDSKKQAKNGEVTARVSNESVYRCRPRKRAVPSVPAGYTEHSREK